MFSLAIMFLIIALIAGVLGFGGLLVGTALWCAKVVFIVALILCVIGFFQGRGPRL